MQNFNTVRKTLILIFECDKIGVRSKEKIDVGRETAINSTRNLKYYREKINEYRAKRLYVTLCYQLSSERRPRRKGLNVSVGSGRDSGVHNYIYTKRVEIHPLAYTDVNRDRYVRLEKNQSNSMN